jgi:AbrB family looped-hinge helix DNA binding protein
MTAKRRNRDRALARRAEWEIKRAMIRAKNQITLPAEVSKALHVQEGDEVEFDLTEDGEVVLRGRTSIPAEQRWFWEQDWQAGEREASEQIERGELVGPFDGPDDLLTSLHADD